MNSPAPRAARRLQASLIAAEGSAAVPLLQAELVGLLVQQGDFEAARPLLDEVREAQARDANAVLAAWLCLAEGLYDQYSSQLPSARDRIRRAHVLASAARTRPLIARCAAWLAHLAYAYGDLPALGRHLAEAFQESDPAQHATRARAHLVAAQAYHWAGRLDLAQPYYERSRQHALAEGDQCTVSALLSNRAAIVGARLHLAAVFEPEAACEQTLRQALLGAESSGSLNELIGRRSLRSLAPLLRAQLLSVQGEHAAALALFEEHLPLAAAEGYDYLEPVLRAEMAWCLLKLDRPDEALAAARLAVETFGEDCEEEDRARANGRIAQVFDGLGLPDDAARHWRQGRADLQALHEVQARMLQVLDAAFRQVLEAG